MRRCLLAGAMILFGAGSDAFAASYQQSPTLGPAVEAGKLPAVAARLPQDPDVVKPSASVGTYGGTLRNALDGDADHNAILRIVGNVGLTRWSPDFQQVIPNIAASWSSNATATEFTFKLRPGMKWSDGQPFTSSDITFFVNDLLPDPAFFPVPPAQYATSGHLMTATAPDPQTVVFKFAAPYASFPEVLATPLGQHPVFYARHYCAQFDPKFNPKVAAEVSASGLPNWATLLRQKCGDIETPARWANPERPVLDPWVVVRPYIGGASEVTMRRNPFFWQVDTAGNQLPYIGNLDFHVVSNAESMLLAAIGGQLDLQLRYISTIGNKPVLAQNAKRGHYALVALTPTDANAVEIYLNQTDKNAKLRALLTNKNFRIALSEGLDRNDINQIVFLGQSQPWQGAPLPQDRFYNKQLATQYLSHDPAAANALLDKLGLTKRDSAGFREYPDGTRLFLSADVMIDDLPAVDTVQLMKQQWAAVGINLGINTMQRSLFYERGQNNDYDIDLEPAPGGLHPTLDPRIWLSVQALDSRQSIPWVQYYMSGGKAGERPSPSMMQRLHLWNEWKATSDAAKADALFKQILQIAADQFEDIGTVQSPTVFGIRNVDLMNVPASMPNGWAYPNPAPTLPQQYYFKRPG